MATTKVRRKQTSNKSSRLTTGYHRNLESLGAKDTKRVYNTYQQFKTLCQLLTRKTGSSAGDLGELLSWAQAQRYAISCSMGNQHKPMSVLDLIHIQSKTPTLTSPFAPRKNVGAPWARIRNKTHVVLGKGQKALLPANPMKMFSVLGDGRKPSLPTLH